MSPFSKGQIALIALGIVVLATSGAMVLLKWHHTVGYGGLGAGLLLTLVGAGMALKSRNSSGEMKRKDSKLPRALRPRQGKLLRTFIVAAIIVGATLASFVYVETQISSQSGNQFGLSLNVASASEVTYPDGSIGVTLYVTAVGGIGPYTFTAVWGDKTNQTSTTGNFTRVFGAAVPLATALTINAKSSNSGLGFLSLTLPSQVPVANGQVSTRTLNIVPSNGANGPQPGGAAASTRTAGSNTFIAVTNASIPTISSSSTSSFATTAAGSRTSSGSTPPEGYEVVMTVRGETSGKLISGATVTIDRTTTQKTPLNGTVFFFGISEGVHSFVITYGTWSTTIIPYIAQGSPPLRWSVNVPGQ